MNFLPLFVIGGLMLAAGSASASKRRRRGGGGGDGGGGDGGGDGGGGDGGGDGGGGDGADVLLPPSDVFTTCPLESYGFGSTLSDNIRRYAGAAEAAAFEQGIDPDLLMGQVMVESTWNPEAESNAGAVGLVQIMPGTGEWIAEKSGLPDDRRDPANNLRMAAWLIRFLFERWDGDLDLALAAYFAGSGNVQKALNNTGTVPQSYANYANAVYERQIEFASIRDFCAEEAA